MSDYKLGAVEARFADIVWENEPLPSNVPKSACNRHISVKSVICIAVCLLLLLLCGCQKTSADDPSFVPSEEATADRLVREIDGAYREAQKLPENSTNVGMTELADTYREKWEQTADEYYQKLMQYDGIISPAEHYATSEDLHAYVTELQTEWNRHYETKCEQYLKILKACYQGGTIVVPLMAQYRYNLQMEYALELVGICQMFQIA